jgi:glycosyltransferase 2 family protein
MKVPIYFILKRLTPGLVLGFIVLIGLALIGDLRAVSQSLKNFRWEFFLVAIGFTLFNYLLRFIKWHFYLGQVGIRDIHWAQSLRIFVAGFPLAVTPGKIGEALKGVWLNRTCKLPVGRGVSVVLAERISDGLAVMILSILGVIAYPQYWPVFVVILAVLLAFVVLSQIRPVAFWLLGIGEKLPVVNKFVHSLREFYEGSFTLFHPGVIFLAVLLGAISWLGEGIGFYYILLGLGHPPGLKLLASAIFVLAFSTAIGGATAMPGGLGAAELTIAGLLSLVLQESAVVATSATVLIRLATLWFGVALGLFTWSFSRDLLGMSTEHSVHVEGKSVI